MLTISIELLDEIEMSLGQTLRKSYRELQNSWTRLADSAFCKADTGRQDEMARGEFISAFISERDLNFPAPRHGTDRPKG